MLSLRPVTRKRANDSSLRRVVNTILYSRFSTALIAALVLAMLSACGDAGPAGPVPGSLTLGLLISIGVLLVVYVVAMAVARMISRVVGALYTLLGNAIKIAVAAGVSGVAILAMLLASAFT